MPWRQSTEAGIVSRGHSRGYTGASYNNDDHSNGTFPSNENCRADQDQDGHGDSSQGKSELNVLFDSNNDHKLNSEPKEEKEIKFE